MVTAMDAALSKVPFEILYQGKSEKAYEDERDTEEKN